MAKETGEHLKQEYQQLLVKQSKEAAEREVSFAQTIQELRSVVNRSNERFAWREDELNNEIQVRNHLSQHKHK